MVGDGPSDLTDEQASALEAKVRDLGRRAATLPPSQRLGAMQEWLGTLPANLRGFAEDIIALTNQATPSVSVVNHGEMNNNVLGEADKMSDAKHKIVVGEEASLTNSGFAGESTDLELKRKGIVDGLETGAAATEQEPRPDDLQRGAGANDHEPRPDDKSDSAKSRQVITAAVITGVFTLVAVLLKWYLDAS